MKLSMGEVLMHEMIGHAIPILFGGGTGNAIKNDNIARKELDLQLRKPDPRHKEKMQ